MNKESRHAMGKAKTPADREQDKQYKQWMEYVQSTTGANDDLGIAEEEFDQAVSRDHDWETDKVWTGPSIPESYLRELENSDKLKQEMSNFEPEPEAPGDFPPFILLPVPDIAPIPPDPEDLPEGISLSLPD